MTNKFILKVFIAFVLLPIGVISCSKNDERTREVRAQNYIDRAESYRQQGQYRAAIIETRNALQQNPHDRAATLKLARIFTELGQAKTAIKLLEPIADKANRDEAITIAQSLFLQHKYQSCLDYIIANSTRLQLDDDREANLLKARAQMRLDQTKAARDTLAKLSPTDVSANLERERISRQEGDLAASQNQLETLLRQHPDNIEILLEAAAQAEASGDLEHAEDLLSKTLMNLPSTDVLTPQKAETLQRLITTSTKLGRSNEALAYSKTLADANPEGVALQDKLKQAVELFQEGKLTDAEPLLLDIYKETHNDTVGSLLGMIRFAKNDMRGAADYLTTNVDPETTDDTTLTALAATQLELAQPDKLLQIFDKQARARINSPELKVLIGIALLQTDSTTEGERMVNEALQAKPDNPAIASAIARFYLQSRQPAKAVSTLQNNPKIGDNPSLSRLLIAAYLATKQNDLALGIAQKLTQNEPNNVESWWVLGRTALHLRDLNTAHTALYKTLELQPNYTPAKIDLAQLYVLRKQPDQAATLYREILKQNPDTIGALKGLVIALSAQGTEPDALKQKILATADNVQSRTVLADYFLSQGRYENAQQLLNDLTDNASEYTLRIKLLAVLKGAAIDLQERKFNEARTRVLEGLKAAPRNPDLMIMLARIEQAAGRLDEAIKIAAQLSTQQSQYPPAQELLADLAMLEQQSQKAAQYYRQIWDKTHSDAIGQKLYQSLAMTDKPAADNFLRQWQQSNPNGDMPYFLLGAQQQLTGDASAAIAAYEAAVARNPSNASALNNLAVLYQERNDSRALITAERAYQLAPKDPAILDTYGWLLVQNHQREKGLRLLQQAAILVPNSAEVKQHLRDAQSNTQ